jgi:hypothetical protein
MTESFTARPPEQDAAGADGGGPTDLLAVLGSDVEAAAIDVDVRRPRDLPREVELREDRSVS